MASPNLILPSRVTTIVALNFTYHGGLPPTNIRLRGTGASPTPFGPLTSGKTNGTCKVGWSIAPPITLFWAMDVWFSKLLEFGHILAVTALEMWSKGICRAINLRLQPTMETSVTLYIILECCCFLNSSNECSVLL